MTEKREHAGCGMGLGILVFLGLMLSLAGFLVYVVQARQHEEQAALRVEQEAKLQAALAKEEARAQEERAEQAKREAAAAAEKAAEKAAERARLAHEAEQVEALHEDVAEAAPGVSVGARLRVYVGADAQVFKVVEVRGTRARVESEPAQADRVTWIDFSQVPRYDVLR